MRILVPDGLASGIAPASGGALKVRPWGVSGWREILIRSKLARSAGLVSYRNAAGLLDHLVGAAKHRGRYHKAKRGRGFEIDEEFQLGRLLDRQVARLGAPENLVDQACGAEIEIRITHPICHQSTDVDKLLGRIDFREPVLRGQIRDTLPVFLG